MIGALIVALTRLVVGGQGVWIGCSPGNRQRIYFANHSSHLDALTLSAVLRGEAARSAHSLAAGDTFFTSTLGSAFAAYAVNALPIWRKRTRPSEIATLRERLLQDRLVYILFP